MKITDYMRNAMDTLEAEFVHRRAMGISRIYEFGRGWDSAATGSDGYLGAYVDRPFYTLGMTRDEFIMVAGAREMAGGANSSALVFHNATIKWSRQDELESHIATDEDAAFYQDLCERFPKYRKYLAATVQRGRFTVQETIEVANEAIHDLNDEERFDVFATVIRIAHELGLRDVHMGNWGFRPGDKTTPVIFDFSERNEPGSYMNWDRLNAMFDWDDWALGREYEEALQSILDDLNMAAGYDADGWPINNEDEE